MTSMRWPSWLFHWLLLRVSAERAERQGTEHHHLVLEHRHVLTTKGASDALFDISCNAGESLETDFEYVLVDDDMGFGFREHELLGKGSYASVYKVKRRRDEVFFALKEFKSIPELRREPTPCDGKFEALPGVLGLPYVVGVEALYYDSTRGPLKKLNRGTYEPAMGNDEVSITAHDHQRASPKYIVMPAFEAGTLQTLIEENCETISNGLCATPQTQVKSYMAQLAMGIYTLHVHGIIHRDVKPENVFFDDVNRESVSLADFGCVQVGCDPLRSCSQDQAGSEAFWPPDYQEGYSFEFDWWSWGVTANMLLTGEATTTLPEGMQSAFPLWFDLLQNHIFKNGTLASRREAMVLLSSDSDMLTTFHQHPIFGHPVWLEGSTLPDLRSEAYKQGIYTFWRGICDVKCAELLHERATDRELEVARKCPQHAATKVKFNYRQA